MLCVAILLRSKVSSQKRNMKISGVSTDSAGVYIKNTTYYSKKDPFDPTPEQASQCVYLFHKFTFLKQPQSRCAALH